MDTIVEKRLAEIKNQWPRKDFMPSKEREELEFLEGYLTSTSPAPSPGPGVPPSSSPFPLPEPSMGRNSHTPQSHLHTSEDDDHRPGRKGTPLHVSAIAAENGGVLKAVFPPKDKDPTDTETARAAEGPGEPPSAIPESDAQDNMP